MPEGTWHVIIIGDSRDMREIGDETVHLVVTSPPYVTSKFERGQRFDLEGYLCLIRSVLREAYRVLIPDGRFCLNVADVHTKYFFKDDSRFYRVPLAHIVLQIALDEGFRLLETYIWDKGFNRYKGGAPGPLFGSYPYPHTIYSNVYWEYVFVLTKPGPRRRVDKEVREMSRLSRSRWEECVRSFWRISSESSRVRGHPSVFPVELARRCIELYSFVGDTVLDPFLGSGTTTLAARMTRRNSIGYEVNSEYLPLIKRRIFYKDRELFGARDVIKIITERKRACQRTFGGSHLL